MFYTVPTLCINISTLCPIGQGQTVRLANSNSTIGSQYEGRVEIYHNGTWGTICDHDWELADAKVACRMLGFSGALRAVTNAFYGRGTGRVWLDNVECTGTETSLVNCQHNAFGTVDSNCLDHHNDAGVMCFDGRSTRQVLLNPSFFSKHLIHVELVRINYRLKSIHHQNKTLHCNCDCNQNSRDSKPLLRMF